MSELPPPCWDVNQASHLAPIPEACDVAIIGAGAIGVFAALYLAEAGKRVLVCDKGVVAGEQSSRNWGWIRQHGRDRDELPIMMEASRLWEEVDKKIDGRTGFHRGGVMYLASSEKELEKRAEWLEVAKECQLDTRLISKGEVDRLVDRSGQGTNRHKWAGATYTPSDGRAEAWQAIPAIAELAVEQGVTIREHCAVRALEIAAGKVTGIVTEHGSVRCEQVIVAAGAWSSLFLKRHGVSIPQLSVKSTACRTEKLPKFFDGNAADETLAFRRCEDGAYNLAGGASSVHFIGRDSFRNFFKYLPVFSLHFADMQLRPAAPACYPDAWGTPRNWSEDKVSPFERVRILHPEPNHRQIEKIRANFATRFPAIGKPRITHRWAGMIDAMPDVVPIVDRVPDLPGLIVATGMSGHGFGIGPGFGRILARIVQENPVGHDISRFRFSRFADGSPLRPGPGI